MNATTKKRGRAPQYATYIEAFAAWRDAAAKWRRLRSDAAEAECRKARTAFYTLAYGKVPPIRNDWRAEREGEQEGAAL